MRQVPPPPSFARSLRQVKNAAAVYPNRYGRRNGHVALLRPIAESRSVQTEARQPTASTTVAFVRVGPRPPRDFARPFRLRCKHGLFKIASTYEVVRGAAERRSATRLSDEKGRCWGTAPRLWRPPLGPARAPPPPSTPETHVSRLYPEILALIFSRLPIRDRGRAAQTCRAWREAAYSRSVWRGAEARLHLRRPSPGLFASLVRRGIRRVQVLSLRRSLRDVVVGVPDLESLNLSGCYNVTDAGLVSAFSADLPRLRSLDLSLCKQITDGSLGQIAHHLKNLENLDLGGCSNVTDTGLLLIAWGLSKLKRLDLRSCWSVSDRGIGHLAGLDKENAAGTPCLERLGLQDCQRLSDEALRHAAAGFPALVALNLSFCVSITDSGLKHVARMGSLRDLNLRACDNITDAGLAHLAEGGSSISSLDVSFCDKIGDRALTHVSQGLFRLRSLSMSACRISDEGLDRVSRALPELEALHIGQCQRVSDRGLAHVAAGLTRLRSIDLYGCPKITADALQRLSTLPHLQDLNLGLWHVS